MHWLPCCATAGALDIILGMLNNSSHSYLFQSYYSKSIDSALVPCPQRMLFQLKNIEDFDDLAI